MITRREDLHGTWVDVTKDHGVVKLFAAVYDKDALFGCEISKPYNELVCGNPCVAISIDSRGGWAKHTDKPFHPTLREVTMSDFTPSNDVKYYDKDEEIKSQDGFVSNAIKDAEISYKDYSDSELKNLQEKTNHKWERFQDCYAKTKEELMSDSKVPRTKTEYVRVTDSIFDLKDELNDGKLYFQNETTDYVFISVNDELILTKELKRGNIYRKVNRIATWKDCVLDFIEIDCGGLNSSEVCDFWFIMNKKPEFVIKLSHLIAEMTDKPEL